ncbi:MAG: thioether cross-link-forming SCIFF peptide maturase, partial [Lachnospiraceae bacterium]|nr:thioether cross-link-forming SCIFF peptide maturase [Lachnospiraceae bacterium]
MIHQYKNNGYNIVMDVNSGSVHSVDEVVYDVIEGYSNIIKAAADEGTKLMAADFPSHKDEIIKSLSGKYSDTDIAEAMEDVEELISEELLFTEDVYKEYIIDFKKRKTVVKALCLHIAHDCNLACKYCFAEEGEYHGRRALMSFEVGKRALDFLVENSGNRVNLEVDFFGGEPLMNWQVVKDLVKYGREIEKKHNKNFRFTLTTNGMLLNDEIMEFANKEMSNVVLSLDGRKEINDLMRPTRNGKGSYDIIVPKFQKFAESRNQTNYFVRGTFTRINLDFSEDVIHY